MPQAAEEQKKPLSEVLKNAAKRAMGGGAAGAMAMFVNVGTLMCVAASQPLRPRCGHAGRARVQVDAHDGELPVR